MNTYKICITDAIVIVDPNNDFSNEKGSLYVKGVLGERSNEDVNQGIKDFWKQPFGYKVISLDAHHEGHYEFEKYGVHALINTWGQHINENLKQEFDEADEILLKGEDIALASFSISSSREFHRHMATLRAKGIKRIFFVGWAFNVCVGNSAVDYKWQGFDVYVVRDLTRSIPPSGPDVNWMTEVLRQHEVSIINTEQIR